MSEITYLIETKDAFFKMTLPERYRLTLGPLVPASKNHVNKDNLVLRVYDGTKQRGIFHNVVCFRDIAILIFPGRMVEGEVVWDNPIQMVEALLVTEENF